MAFVDLFSEIRGSVPKLSILAAKKFVNRAWQDIREKNLWSFLLGEAAWIAPPQVNSGTVHVTTGLNTVTFDVTAKAAINANQIANPYSLITQRQLRVGSSQLYNIISYNSGTGAATLDRIWADSGNTAAGFLMLQDYYASPTSDFKRWLSVRDMNNVVDLFTSRYNKETLDQIDPQRMIYGVATDVVPFGRDQRGSGTSNASATLNFPLFELWPIPNFQNSYDLVYLRSGTDLVNNSDTINAPVQEQTVVQKAKYFAYEWAEANKGQFPELQETDWRFLMGGAMKEYQELWRKDRRADRENFDAWFFVRRGRISPRNVPYYNSLASVAGPVL